MRDIKTLKAALKRSMPRPTTDNVEENEGETTLFLATVQCTSYHQKRQWYVLVYVLLSIQSNLTECKGQAHKNTSNYGFSIT